MKRPHTSSVARGHRRRVVLLSVTAALTSGCALGSLERTSAADCATNDDCGLGRVCFFSTCVDPGFDIAELYADVSPPAGSTLLPQGDRQPRSASTEQSIILKTAPVTGTLTSSDLSGFEGVLKAKILRSAGEPHLPSFDFVAQATVTDSLFDLRLTPGAWRLTFEPTGSAAAAATLPPITFAEAVDPELQGTLALAYPTAASLVHISGKIVRNATTTDGLSGLLVSGSQILGAGPESPLSLRSSTSATELGQFALVFPPGVTAPDLDVRPGTNPLAPTVQYPAVPFGNVGGALQFDSLSLDIFTAASPLLSGRVEDENGAPVANASLFFEGQIGSGRYVTAATTDGDGAFANVDLIPGNYVITLAPPVDAPFALSTMPGCVAPATEPTFCAAGDLGAQPLILVARPKVLVTGRVRDAEGAAVHDARVVMTTRQGVARRSFATTTSSDGRYELLVDPGESGPLLYDLVVEPPRETALPRFLRRAEIDDGPTTLDVTLFAGALVFGEVRDSEGRPVSGAVVAFYSVELGSLEEPVLVGLGQTDEAGGFVVPVPKPGP